MRLWTRIGLVFCILTSMENKAYAHETREVDPLSIVFGLVILTGVPVGVWALAHYSETLSESRKDKFFILERGGKPDFGHSYSIGGFFSSDQLLFGRYSQTSDATVELKFKTYEAGYRHYFNIVFGEIGVFHAKHHIEDKSRDRLGVTHPYQSNSYETNGVFGSLGVSAHFRNLSGGVRCSLYNGLSKQIGEVRENRGGLPDSAENVAEEFRLKHACYLDVGIAL